MEMLPVVLVLLAALGAFIFGWAARGEENKMSRERGREIYATWKEVEDFIGDLHLDDLCGDSCEDLFQQFKEYCPRIVAKVEGKN